MTHGEAPLKGRRPRRVCARRRRSRRARRRRPRSRPPRVSSDGTTQHASPAALAARSPRSESSTTRHRSRGTPQALDGAQVGLGIGLGLLVLLARERQLEVVEDARARVHGRERLRLGARHDRQAKAARERREPRGDARQRAGRPSPEQLLIAAIASGARLVDLALADAALAQPVPRAARRRAGRARRRTRDRARRRSARAPRGWPGNRIPRCRRGRRRCRTGWP